MRYYAFFDKGPAEDVHVYVQLSYDDALQK